MSLLYLLSMVILYVSFMFYKKNDKPLNFTVWSIASLAMLMCYNSFITWIMTLMHIPINIFTYPLINIVLSGILLYGIFFKKKIQKYSYNYLEIIGLIILLMFTLVISIWYFGWPLEIKYQTTDPNVHYFASNIFSRSTSLLSNVEENLSLYESQRGMMNLFYANAGLFMKSFSSFFGEIENYIIFICYNIYSLFLSGGILYASVLKFCKNKTFLFITIILCMFYLGGYPLNEMMFGFGYLGSTVIVINLLLILIREIPGWIHSKSNEVKFINLLNLFLAVFSIFFGYYLFVPFVYAALFIYLCLFFYKEGLLFGKIFWITGIVVLGIPTVIGFIVYFLPSFVSMFASSDGNEQLAQVGLLGMEGYIYRDLYSNFLFFVPTLLYFLFSKIKKRIWEFDWILTVLLILYILAMFILGMKGTASSYYYYKNYYVLAFMLYYVLIASLSKLYFNDFKIIINSCLVTILIMFTLFQLNFDAQISKVNILFNVSPKLAGYFDIYALNKVYKSGNAILNKDQIELVHIMNDELKKDDGKVLVAGDTLKRLWFFAFTKHVPNLIDNNTFGPFYDEPATIDEFIKSDKNYMLVFSKEKINGEELSHIQEIYSNSEGYILCKE